MRETPLQIRNLSKAYGSVPALRDVSLDVPAGSCTLVLGPNGAGKSTLLRLLAGLSRPDSGEINGLPEPGAVTFMNHEPFAYPRLSALENLAFWTRLAGLSPSPGELEDLLAEVGLAESRNTPTANFSQGLRQRLNLARAFASRPALALLDEALSGLDRQGEALLLRQIELNRAQGGATLLAGHQLAGLLPFADQVLVLKPQASSGPRALASSVHWLGPAAAYPAGAGSRSEEPPRLRPGPPIIRPDPPRPRPEPPLLRAALRIAGKDLRLMRRGAALPLQALLVGLVAIFLFGLGQPGEFSPALGGAIFWIASLLCQTLLAEQLFQLEQPGNCRLGLSAAPIAPQAVWLGKTLGGLALLLACQAILLPALLLFLDQSLAQIPWSFPAALLLTDLGLAALACLLAAFPSVPGRRGLVAALACPLVIPLLLAAGRLTESAFTPALPPGPDHLLWLGIPVAFNALALGAGLLLFPLLFDPE